MEWQTYVTFREGGAKLGIALYEPSGDCARELEDPRMFKPEETQVMDKALAELEKLCDTLNAAINKG